MLDDPTGGVCVGRPSRRASVRIVDRPDRRAAPTGDRRDPRAAPWVSDGYLDLWATRTRRRGLFDGDAVWHRSGDVGHLDDAGRLWVEGRTVHVIHGESGPITPVPVERAVERGLGVARSAAVGVGPVGVQQLVVVLEDPASPMRAWRAPPRPTRSDGLIDAPGRGGVDAASSARRHPPQREDRSHCRGRLGRRGAGRPSRPAAEVTSTRAAR